MDEEEEACKRLARSQRGPYRIEIQIEGRRISVWCRSDCVRIVIRSVDGPSQIETDLVERVEVGTWCIRPALSWEE